MDLQSLNPNTPTGKDPDVMEERKEVQHRHGNENHVTLDNLISQSAQQHKMRLSGGTTNMQPRRRKNSLLSSTSVTQVISSEPTCPKSVVANLKL